VKLLATGDWHLRYKSPKYRTDDYFESQVKKVGQILKIAEDNNCDFILQPGDFFDSADTPDFVIQYYINLLKEYEIPVYSVFGQHDLRYHSSKIENTPLAIMKASEVVDIVDQDFTDRVGVPMFLYTCHWGQDIPDIVRTKNGDSAYAIHILLIHKMIIEEKLWEGQTDYIKAKSLLKRYDFDIIVSGDNHNSFFVQHENKALINCGSLMRSSISQIDHKPCVYLVNIERQDREIVYVFDKIFLDIEPSENVFDIKQHDKEEKRSKELDLFVEGLNSSDEKSIKVNFVDRLIQYSNKQEQGVRDVIQEAMER